MHDAILEGEGGWDSDSRAAYHVFDIMWLDGRDLMSLPLEDRRAVLATLPLHPPLGRVEELQDGPWEGA